MPNTEDRIVKIEFDNGAFEQKIGNTLLSLGNLEKALQFDKGVKGFGDLSAAAKNVDLSGMAAGVDNISNKFTAMGAVGFSVIQSLTQSAVGFVEKLGSKLLDPIFQGGLTRSLAIEQARFMFQGLGVDADAATASAKAAVLGTSYGLGSAAKAAAQFAASGIAVGDQMTGALRGVAGAAAMTGTSFEEIAYIFTGIAGANKVNSQDLMQFSTRGLNAAAAMAKAMGTTEQAVRDMVSNGQMDFATFAKAMDDAFGAHATSANQTFTGALANMKSALGRLGAAFIGPELVNFRDVFNSLTPQIDGFTAAIKPAIDMVSLLAKDVTGQLVTGINGINFDSLKAAMPDVVTGMVNIFRAMENIWNIGKQAFQQIFPPDSISIIQKVATAFREFSEHIQVSVGAMNTIRSIFQGVFSILSIGWEVVKDGAKFFLDLGKSIAGIFGPGVVGGLAKIGDFFTNLQDSLVKGGGIKSFFDGLEQALQKPIEFLGKAKDAIANLFSGFSKDAADKVGDAATNIGDKFDNMKERLKSVWDPFKEALLKIKDVLEPIGQNIAEWFKGLWDKLAEGLTSGDFNNVLDALNTALLGGLAAILAKFLKGGINVNFGSIMTNIGGTLNQVTNTLSGMQTVLKAQALMKIAEAIGLLTISIVALSLIDSESLTKSLTAISVGFGQLMLAFAGIEKLSVSGKGAIDFVAIAFGLNLLAGAIIGLSIAVAIMSTLDWDGLLKGLTGVLILLGGISLAVKPLSANAEGMIAAGFAIGEIAAGMLILSIAMKIMGSMSWDELVKGLLGVAVGLGAMVVALNLMPNDLAMVKAGISIMAIATAMVVMGAAMKIFASSDWESLGKGLLGMAVSMGIVVAAVNLMPKDAGSSAAGIMLVAIAVVALSVAMKTMAGMSWEDLAKGLVGIAVSLGLLVAAALLMEAGIPGAAAMVVVAGALVVLSKAIQTIGAMSWEDLAKGLIGLALGIGLIAAASILLTPAIPEIAALGVALILLGAGIALIGVGAYAFAEALKVIADAGTKLIENLPDIFEAIAKSIPSLLKGFAEGLVEMIQVFTDAAPSIMKAVGIFLTYLIDTLIKLSPKLLQLLRTLLDDLITLVYEYTEPLIAAGMHIIISFLQGISDNIEQIVTIVASIITKFMDSFAEAIPGMVDSLVNLLATMFTEVARGLGELMPTLMIGIPEAFADGFITGMQNALSGPIASFLSSIPGLILTALSSAADFLTTLAQKGVDLITGLYNGAVSVIGTVTSWVAGIPGTVLGAIGDCLSTLVSKGGDFLTGLLNGAIGMIGGVLSWISGIPGAVLTAIGDCLGTLVSKGGDLIRGLKNGITDLWTEVTGWFGNLGGEVQGFFKGAAGWLWAAGVDIVQGLWDGIKSIWSSIKNWLEDKVGDLIDTITHPWEIFSPSHLMRRLGENIMKGWVIGFKDGYKDVDKFISNIDAADKITSNMSDGLTSVVSGVANKLSDLPEFQPKITPVLDLTRVAADAGKIGDYIQKSQRVSASISFNNAQVIASAQNGQSAQIAPEVKTPNEVKFEQNIYSPTQLSAREIYKQTRNQITMAKEELSIP